MRVAFPNSSAKAPSPDPRTSAIFGRSFVFDKMNFAARVACSNSPDPVFAFAAAMCAQFDPELRKNPDNRSRDEIRHRPRQHRSNTELRQLAPLLRRQRSDAADLDSDRAEIRKSAKRERRDREAAGIERRLDLSQLGERDKLIQYHARPE